MAAERTLSHSQKKRLALAWWVWLKMDDSPESPDDILVWLNEFFRMGLEKAIEQLKEEFEDFPSERFE